MWLQRISGETELRLPTDISHSITHFTGFSSCPVSLYTFLYSALWHHLPTKLPAPESVSQVLLWEEPKLEYSMAEISVQDSLQISRPVASVDGYYLNINMTQTEPIPLTSAPVPTLISASDTLCTLDYSVLAWSTQVPKLEIPESNFLFYFVYYIGLLTKSYNFEMSLKFVPRAEEKLGENHQFTRGSFSSNKEIVQASSWHSQNESGMKVLQVQNALGTLERVCFHYKYAEMCSSFFIRSGCWFNHEITGTVA